MANNSQTQLHHEHYLHITSLMRRQKMVKIIYQKRILCIPTNAFISKQRQNSTKITDLALGRMILEVFPQTGGVLQDGQNEPQHAKFRHFMAEWGYVLTGAKYLIDL